MKRTRFPAVATAASLVVMLSAAAQGCGGDEGPAAPPVPEQELLAAMEAAIQDEYHAEEVYLKVLHDFGDVLPFHNIVVAEVRHSTSIGRLFENRGWSVPTSEWNGDSVPGFATLAGACAAGVEAELANIALYDELLARDLPADVERVFENVRAASLNNHLPAFEGCR
jgi:hypothetical protein